MAKREFLMLAHVLKKQLIHNWFVSEKLDGQRAFWDGGISRGTPKVQIPYANCAKDARYKEAQVATGLWSRYGNVIHAPDYFLDALPKHFLDGELFIGRGQGQRQSLMKVIKQLKPNEIQWSDVKYYVFDIPSVTNFATFGTLNNPNFKIKFDSTIESWLLDNADASLSPRRMFIHVLPHLKACANDIVIAHEQQKLPFSNVREVLDAMLDKVLAVSGEGLIIRDPDSIWEPKRTNSILKYKPFEDAEATITGFIGGNGKYEGMIGAIITNFEGKRLELSGFTDMERQLESHLAPGEESYADVSTCFKIGESITFRYRELSADGIPTEARYLRRHDEQ